MGAVKENFIAIKGIEIVGLKQKQKQKQNENKNNQTSKVHSYNGSLFFAG